MNPTSLNKSSAMQCFECSNAYVIRGGDIGGQGGGGA